MVKLCIQIAYAGMTHYAFILLAEEQYATIMNTMWSIARVLSASC